MNALARFDLHRAGILALVLLVAGSLGACDGPGTTTRRNHAGDGRVESLQVRTHGSFARFDCRESTPGPCRVQVYTSTCALDGPADLAPRCGARTLHAFTLPVGEARELEGLPAGFRWCMRHGARGKDFCRRS